MQEAEKLNCRTESEQWNRLLNSLYIDCSILNKRFTNPNLTMHQKQAANRSLQCQSPAVIHPVVLSDLLPATSVVNKVKWKYSVLQLFSSKMNLAEN